jgi:hypothetical protein
MEETISKRVNFQPPHSINRLNSRKHGADSSFYINWANWGICPKVMTLSYQIYSLVQQTQHLSIEEDL